MGVCSRRIGEVLIGNVLWTVQPSYAAPQAEGGRKLSEAEPEGCSFSEGHRVAPGQTFHRTSNETEMAVGMGWLCAVDVASRSYRDATPRVEMQIDLGTAHGTDLKELCVSSWPFIHIELARIEELQLCATGRIDAATDHETPHKFLREVP